MKHSFYTKERKYCSRGCAKAAAKSNRSAGRFSAEKDMNKSAAQSEVIIAEFFIYFQGSYRSNHTSVTSKFYHSIDQVLTVLDPGTVAMDAMKRATMCSRVPNSNAAYAAVHFKPPKIGLLDETRTYEDLEYQTGPFTFDTEGSYDWADCIGDPEFRAAPVSCFRHVSLQI